MIPVPSKAAPNTGKEAGTVLITNSALRAQAELRVVAGFVGVLPVRNG